jgi:hypothetical protein
MFSLKSQQEIVFCTNITSLPLPHRGRGRREITSPEGELPTSLKNWFIGPINFSHIPPKFLFFGIILVMSGIITGQDRISDGINYRKEK